MKTSIIRPMIREKFEKRELAMCKRISSQSRGISRRQLLKYSGALAGALALNPRLPLRSSSHHFGPRVVHVHSTHATGWDFSTGWYGDHVDQAVVYEMVDWGVMALTGTASRAAAWQALLPAYSPGQRVAIKINLNNAQSENDDDNVIDALIEPVNGVVRGLIEIGVAAADIWVFDAIRPIPSRLRDGCAFSGVRFSGGSGSDALGFSATERVTFQPSGDVPPLASRRISNVLVDADYLINMPILKKHCCAWVSLSFKNHLGSIQDCAGLHEYIFPYEGIYRSGYSPMVDIYSNRHVGAKTVLTIGDGLYGSRGHQSSAPRPWVTFGDRAPNSLFFSTDPVALDCVMYDFIDAEVGVPVGGDDYLALAAGAGLGVFEHRDPQAARPGQWYNLIDYVQLSLDQPLQLGAHWEGGVADLAWTRPWHAALAGYRVYYTSETGGPVDQGTSPIDVPDPNQLTLQLTGLTMHAVYELWVEAHDGSGDPLAESNHAFVLPTDTFVYLPLIH
jgi:uncharacterized protein (DUF362 family)